MKTAMDIRQSTPKKLTEKEIFGIRLQGYYMNTRGRYEEAISVFC
jgi:hypothetical protein